jgi:uncharacterized protein (TIGR03435 family)
MRLLTLTTILSCSLAAQDTVRATFEVASVKPAGLPPRGQSYRLFYGGPGTDTPERMTWKHSILSNVLTKAFVAKVSQFSAPNWVMDNAPNVRFDISAALPPGTTKDQSREMVLHFLEDRFGMKWHREMQERTVYAMTVAKGGMKLKPFTDAATGTARNYVVPDGIGVLASGMNLKTIASYIEKYVAGEDAFLVDETGIEGRFQGRLEFADPGFLTPTTKADFKTALEENWGIKLEKQKRPIEIIVIDHIERVPTEN